MTMSTTSAAAPKPATAPAGLYTVPLGSTEKLRKGVAKLQIKLTSPIMKQAAQLVFNSRFSGFLWDHVGIPRAMAVLKQNGVTNVRFPSGNFYANASGVCKAAPLLKVPAGFKYYARKGYDPATGIAFFWVVVN